MHVHANRTGRPKTEPSVDLPAAYGDVESCFCQALPGSAAFRTRASTEGKQSGFGIYEISCL